MRRFLHSGIVLFVCLSVSFISPISTFAEYSCANAKEEMNTLCDEVILLSELARGDIDRDYLAFLNNQAGLKISRVKAIKYRCPDKFKEPVGWYDSWGKQTGFIAAVCLGIFGAIVGGFSIANVMHQAWWI
jgi:hypothetical protein